MIHLLVGQDKNMPLASALILKPTDLIYIQLKWNFVFNTKRNKWDKSIIMDNSKAYRGVSLSSVRAHALDDVKERWDAYAL